MNETRNQNSETRKVLGVFLVSGFLSLVCLGPARATCTGASPTWTSTPDQASVSQCVANAQAGDTINVTAGSATWAVSVTVSKDLAIIGNGPSATVITGSGGDCFVLDLAYTTRVSGFTFTSCLVELTNNPVAGKTFRIDHNSFYSAATWLQMGLMQQGVCNGSPSTVLYPTGLLDHNTFTNWRLLPEGTYCMLADGNMQHALHARSLPIGTGTEAIYIEDNNFIDTLGNPDFTDSNYSGRYVARFNTATTAGGAWEIHSVQGANRAVQYWEIYQNVVTNTGSNGFWYPLIFGRGGTGFIWGNQTSSNYTNDIMLDNVRSMGDPGDGVGRCDGTSNWDENSGTVTGSGYACRDQIGRGPDTTQWTPGQPFTEPLMPAYFWNNVKGTNTPLSIVLDQACGVSNCFTAPGHNPIDIVQNRDWYTQNTSFNGTSGVGVGILANRPASCTTGVAYWAIDQGNWNQSGNGAGQGVLYQCSAPNTWTLYYIPYVYPHPLVSGTTSPPNITAFSASPTSITSGQSSTLSWTVSGETSLSISPSIGNVMGQSSITVSLSTTTIYTLTAANSGGSAFQNVTVTVTSDSSGGGNTTGSFAPQVYPNPWRSDRGYPAQITFDQLTGNTTLKIFTVSGHLVKTLTTSASSIPWDLTNDSGSTVASGIYIYLITDSQGDKVRGKVAVIK